MKKKKNSGEETLRSIRRNSAYSSSRVLALITSVAYLGLPNIQHKQTLTLMGLALAYQLIS